MEPLKFVFPLILNCLVVASRERFRSIMLILHLPGQNRFKLAKCGLLGAEKNELEGGLVPKQPDKICWQRDGTEATGSFP